MRLGKKGLDAYRKVLFPNRRSEVFSNSNTSKLEKNIKQHNTRTDDEKPAVCVAAEKQNSSEQTISGLRKSAELLLMMSKEVAQEALQHMNAHDIGRIMAEIDKIKEERISSSADKEKVGGFDIAQGFLKTAFGDRETKRILRTALPEQVDKPFSFLHNIPEDKIVNLLHNESIEVLAIILPRLKLVVAKRILELVAPFEQSDLVRRIVKIKQVDHEVIVRVEEVLKERLRVSEEPVRSEEFDGQEALAQILRHMSGSKEQGILDGLAKDAPNTARAIERKLFTIDVLFWLSAKDLQARLRVKPNEELALLIKNKSTLVRNLILQALSRRRAEAVLQEETSLGLVAKHEVEKITREFLDDLRDDERQGKLILMRPGESFI